MKSACLALAFFVGGISIYYLQVIQDMPIYFLGPGDIGINEHIPYLFSKLIHWVPFPQISYFTDLVGYPYGTNAAPQTWCFEREWFYYLVSSLFGQGPWLQCYLLLSLAITFVGSFLLLRKEFQTPSSAFPAFLITFFGFYMGYKYPGHFNITVAHWTLLSLVAHFLMALRVWKGEIPSARSVLLITLFLLLALGRDLPIPQAF